MKSAGVAIERWKLPIFKRHLNDAGFDYRVDTLAAGQDLANDTMFLRVKTEFAADLQRVIEAAQLECKTQ